MSESIRVLLDNPAPGHQPTMATVVLPTAACADWGNRAWAVAAEGDQAGLPAVRLDGDSHGTTWGVYGSHAPGEVPWFIVPERAMTAERPWPLPPYMAHEAVWDDLTQLDPEILLLGAPQDIILPKRRVDATAGEQRVDLYTSKGTNLWHADIYLRNYSREPTCQFLLRLIGSDLTSPDDNYPCAGVLVAFGEEVRLDLGSEVGQSVERLPDGRWQIRYHPPEGKLAKGSALDIRGTLLCREGNEHGVDMPADPLDWSEQGLREQTEAELELARYGPVVGECLDWDGHLGIFGVVPEAPKFPEWLTIPPSGDYFDVRRGGMPKQTGSTGSQAAFGVMGRAEVFHPHGQRLHEKLRWLRWTAQRWSICCIHHRDANGRPIAAADHPQMHEFCQQPFKTGKDFLGMTNDQLTPWSGEHPVCDEMHDQLWPLTAWAAISRDPLARDTQRCWIENRMRYVRVWIQKNMGMNRTVGRMTVNLANAGLVDGDSHLPKVKAFMAEQASVVTTHWDGRDVPGPVRPLQVNPPDPRGIVDPKIDPQTGKGTPVPFIFPLFEALGGIGILAGAKLIGDTALKTIAEHILRTYVWEIVWFDSQGVLWHPWQLAWIAGGVPLNEQERMLGSWHWKAGGTRSYYEQGLGAVLLLRDIAEKDGDQATVDRCKRIISAAGGDEPPDRAFGSHHWATGRRVP